MSIKDENIIFNKDNEKDILKGLLKDRAPLETIGNIGNFAYDLADKLSNMNFSENGKLDINIDYDEDTLNTERIDIDLSIYEKCEPNRLLATKISENYTCHIGISKDGSIDVSFDKDINYKIYNHEGDADIENENIHLKAYNFEITDESKKFIENSFTRLDDLEKGLRTKEVTINKAKDMLKNSSDLKEYLENYYRLCKLTGKEMDRNAAIFSAAKDLYRKTNFIADMTGYENYVASYGEYDCFCSINLFDIDKKKYTLDDGTKGTMYLLNKIDGINFNDINKFDTELVNILFPVPKGSKEDKNRDKDYHNEYHDTKVYGTVDGIDLLVDGKESIFVPYMKKIADSLEFDEKEWFEDYGFEEDDKGILLTVGDVNKDLSDFFFRHMENIDTDLATKWKCESDGYIYMDGDDYGYTEEELKKTLIKYSIKDIGLMLSYDDNGEITLTGGETEDFSIGKIPLTPTEKNIFEDKFGDYLRDKCNEKEEI